MKLFEYKKVKKFFDILSRMDRGYSNIESEQIYKGYDKFNPHLVRCQKEVFVNRTVNKWLKGKYLKLYKEDESSGIEFIQYLSILKVTFILGYNDKLLVKILDFAQPFNITNFLNLTYYEIKELEGEWTNSVEHTTLLNLVSLNLPKKEYLFNSYDWSLYPKRIHKNWKVDKLLKKFTILAKTEKEAFKKAKKYCEENKLQLIDLDESYN